MSERAPADPRPVDGGDRDLPGRAQRQGDTVLTPGGPWAPTVITLLRHLELGGFAGAPAVVDRGLPLTGAFACVMSKGAAPTQGPGPTTAWVRSGSS